MEQLKVKIRALRAQMGWTQEELARRIDVSLSTIQRSKTKGSRPTRLGSRELKKLFAKAGLDTTGDWLGTSGRLTERQQPTDLGESFPSME